MRRLSINFFFWAICLWLMPLGEVLADYNWGSSIQDFYGTNVDHYNSGSGYHVPYVEHGDTGSENPSSGEERTFFGQVYVSAREGRNSVYLASTTIREESDIGGQGAFGETQTLFDDYFTILPGTSGLKEGDEVQIKFNSILAGQVVLYGHPQGASSLFYKSTLSGWSSSFGSITHYYSTHDDEACSDYPPEDFSFHKNYTHILTLYIGDILHLTTEVGVWLNSSIHDPGTWTNYLTLESRSFIGYAPGYEDILILSEAGAPIAAVPIPNTLYFLSFALLELGIMLRLKSRA